MNKAIDLARQEYEEIVDRFERGCATRKEVERAQRKLMSLRAEVDLERWLTRAQPVIETA